MTIIQIAQMEKMRRDAVSTPPSRSQEFIVAVTVCSSVELQCLDSTCVAESGRCDGYRDCFHGEDELHCSKFSTFIVLLLDVTLFQAALLISLNVFLMATVSP